MSNHDDDNEPQYRYELNQAEDRFDIYSGVNVIGSADFRDHAEAWVMAMNHPRHQETPTINRIRAAASSMRMKLLDITSSTDDDVVHEAQQYIYIAHALLQQVECNLILGDYALRKAVQK